MTGPSQGREQGGVEAPAIALSQELAIPVQTQPKQIGLNCRFSSGAVPRYI